MPEENNSSEISDLGVKFSKECNKPIFINHIKTHAKSLHDHISDNNIRLIDSAQYVQFRTENGLHDPYIQFVCLQILDELVLNIPKFMQQHISLKPLQQHENESNLELPASIRSDPDC